jgi:hypothetical protein
MSNDEIKKNINKKKHQRKNSGQPRFTWLTPDSRHEIVIKN